MLVSFVGSSRIKNQSATTFKIESTTFSIYQINGSFNFNATPLSPPGTKVLVYETPSTRRSWSPHGLGGWYVGPAMDHYRCFRCFTPKTGSERIAETVQFFPQQVRMPSTSSQDAAIKAIHDLTHAIKYPTAATPTLLLGDEKTHALETLARVFNSAISQPEPSRKQDTIRQEPRVLKPAIQLVLPPEFIKQLIYIG